MLQIIAIDIVLGGDNAVVIALACRRLPERQRNLGIFWDVFGAIGLRVVLIFFALYLLAVPYLKVVGAALLVWIGIKLLQPEDGGEGDVESTTNLWAAIKTILIADLVMSLDNVIAVAAAKGNITLLILGLAISIPLIVFGSTLILKLMQRFPAIITLGAALLGYIAGEMLVSDPLVSDWIDIHAHILIVLMPVGGALFIVADGAWLNATRNRA